MLDEYFTKKYFICFGNKRFIKSRKRIIEEAKQIDVFDDYFLETENVCKEEPYKNIIKKMKPGRGFYWYTWKPYIIYKSLSKLNDGDILFYCDSGMKIFNNGIVKKKFKKLFNLVSNKEKCPTGIVTFITTGPKEKRIEFQYNLVQVFEHFNVLNNKDITHTQQIQAGVSMFLKCDKSMQIVKTWFDTCVTNPEFFIGDYRFCNLKRKSQISGYKDHRHDQSIWSILCKIHRVNVLQHNSNPIHQTHYRE
tara:strand:+ start:28 stop:777 length:750 start_codon:yes stop_codon:yes gene_type:complete